MDREWVEARKVKDKEKFYAKKKEISQKIIEFGKFEEDYEKELLSRIDALEFCEEDFMDKANELGFDICYATPFVASEDYEAYFQFLKDIDSDEFKYLGYFDYDTYLDSEPVFFDGDIIITDPCYIMREDIKSDWMACDYGSNMDILGIHKYMTRDTIYGDWSCTTFDTDKNEAIGEFCADAGLVSVIDLSELLSYNPNFNWGLERSGMATVIKDFKGSVQFVVNYSKETFEYSNEFHEAGDIWENFEVAVVGHGVNKVTGEAINFEGRQTGF